MALQFSKNSFKQFFEVAFDALSDFYNFFVVKFFLETSSMVSNS